MKWRGQQAASRQRHLQAYSADEVQQYEAWVMQLTAEDAQACLNDIRDVFSLSAGMKVLDAGAGTGALSSILMTVPGLSVTALEPSPEMLACFRAKPDLQSVNVVQGFCDSADDRDLLPASAFDVIVCRQLVNGLFDPLTAFRNWHFWLRPGGTVIVLEGLYDRSAWTGPLQIEVDVLPLSACRSTAMVPYLLEQCGFDITAARFMTRTNARPSTKTQRYIVAATRRDP
jgi:SAM-dependent methyltransferase